MLATTLIRLFLRMISLWVGFLSLQRGVLTLFIQDMHVVSAQWTIVLCILFFSLALSMWFLSARLSFFIVGNDEQARTLGWSSQEVVLSGIVLISLYTLFVDAIPAFFDYITRTTLLVASGQYTYLSNPSVFVPGIIAVIKIGLAVFIAMSARFISSRVTSVK
jgi:hypothetical protein